MKPLSDFFDGEQHELHPGEDWQPVEREFRAGEVVELDPQVRLRHNVEYGWCGMAIRFQLIATLLDQGRYSCIQQGDRYLFRYLGERFDGVV